MKCARCKNKDVTLVDICKVYTDEAFVIEGELCLECRNDLRTRGIRVIQSWIAEDDD